MKGIDLLRELEQLTPEELEKDIVVLLCDPNYPIGDGDYDNAYYDYDNIASASFYNDKFVIFGYVK